MKKIDLLFWPLSFGVFVLMSTTLVSHFFFSQLPILETIFLPEVVVGAIFLTIVALILTLILYNIKESACFNVLNFPIIQINYDGKIAFVNNYFKELLSKHNTSMVNSIFDFGEYVSDTKRYRDIFNSLLKNPKAYEKFGELFSTKEGNYFRINIVNVERKRITIVLINETESRQLEQKLNETENMYKKLLDFVPIPIGCRDIEGNIGMANNKLKQLQNDYPEQFEKDEYLKEKEEVKWNKKFGNSIYEIHQIPCYKSDGTHFIRYGIDKTSDYVYKRQLKKKLEYQNALYKIQRLFLNISNENFEEQINKILKSVSEYLETENVYFYELKRDKRINPYEYKKSYVPSFTKKIQKIDPSLDPEFFSIITQNGDFIIENSYTEETNAHKVFSSIGAISVLETCLYSKTFMGMFGVSNFTKQKNWKKDDVAFIKIVGEMMLNTVKKVQVENNLKESDETFTILTENSPLGVIIFDVNNRKNNIYYINQEAIETLGYSKEELNNIKFEDIIDEDFIPTYQQLFEERDGSKGILRINRKDDSVIIEVSLKSIQIAGNKFSKHILCSMVNLDKAMHIFNEDE